jgi:hypothetical protein
VNEAGMPEKLTVLLAWARNCAQAVEVKMLTVAMNAAKNVWIVLVVFIVSSNCLVASLQVTSSFTCT